MPEPAADTYSPSPGRRGWSIAAGALLVLVILGLLAAMWMPAVVGVGPPGRPGPPVARPPP